MFCHFSMVFDYVNWGILLPIMVSVYGFQGTSFLSEREQTAYLDVYHLANNEFSVVCHKALF